MDAKYQARFDSDIAFHEKTASMYDYIAFEPRKVQLELSFRRIAGEIRSGNSFLDLGCGTGHIILRYAHLFNEVIGVDHSPEMLKIAYRHLEETRIKNVKLITSDLFRYLDLSTDQFDFMSCVGCLHHLPVEVIDEFFILTKKRLARRGRILLAEPIDTGTDREPRLITKWNSKSVMPERAKLIPFEESEERPISAGIVLGRPRNFGYQRVTAARSCDIFQHKTPAGFLDRMVIPILHKLYGHKGNTQYALWEVV